MDLNSHPHFSSEFLTRPPGNYCLNCGNRITVNPRFNWKFQQFKYNHGKKIIIGYVHNYPCWEDEEDLRDFINC